MPFRHLIPMVEEMRRHKARAMLNDVAAVRLAMADPQASEVQFAMSDLEEAAGRVGVEQAEPKPLSINQVRATLGALDLEEV